jgi:hypothetical protein
MSSYPSKRKRAVHLYLRDDIVEALEQAATISGLSISRVVEIILSFYWELNGLAQKGRFMAEVNHRFRKTP